MRTIQRAEGGQGIGKENLAAIANALDLDEAELLKLALNAGPPSADKRIALKLVRNGRELVKLLEASLRRHCSLELGPADEHRYNFMIGEDIAVLAEYLEKPARDKAERIERVRHAQGILSFTHKMGFRLFSGNYTEIVVLE